MSITGGHSDDLSQRSTEFGKLVETAALRSGLALLRDQKKAEKDICDSVCPRLPTESSRKAT